MKHYLHQMLEQHFSDFAERSKEERRRCVEGVLLYMFRVKNYQFLTRRLQKLDGSPSAFRMELNERGYSLAIKMYVYDVLYRRVKIDDEEKIKAAGKKYGIRKCDLKLARYLVLSKRLRKALIAYRDEHGFRSVSRENFDRLVVRINDEVKVFIKKFVLRKHKFIIQANGWEVSDVHADLLTHGIQGLMNMYPCIHSKLHARNVVKRTVHNRGINLIKKYTTQSRGTLLRNRDGTFSSIKLSYESLLNERAVDQDVFLASGMSGEVSMGALEQHVGLDIENSLTVKQLMDQHSGIKLRFLRILSGLLDKPFTYYLRVRNLISKTQDNEDLHCKWCGCCKNMERYMQEAADFLGLKMDNVRSWMAELRQQLGGVPA